MAGGVASRAARSGNDGRPGPADGTIAAVVDRSLPILATLAAAGLWTVAGSGCAGPEPPPAAASNEVFPEQPVMVDGTPALDDRWASVVLDDQGRREVRGILFDAADGSAGIEPLGPAPHGVRFEDIPRAMLNTAPKVEMAILRGEHLDPEIVIDFDDAAGRAATATIRFAPRGPLTSVAHRIPGADATAERARLTSMIERRSRAWPMASRPDDVIDEVVRMLGDAGAIVSDRTIRPERWRYTLLMLDEQEATIEIRRVPPPTVVEWTATAGIFPRPEVARSLGDTFMECLRAWGRESRWNGPATSTADGAQ